MQVYVPDPVRDVDHRNETTVWERGMAQFEKVRLHENPDVPSP
eukprot:COSAG05_NODE_2279_length_3291_cov_50.910324_5_plen_43_part_00